MCLEEIGSAAGGNAGAGATAGLSRIAAPSVWSGIGDVAKNLAGPALQAGSQIYNAKTTSDTMADLSQAQQTSYDNYLNTINPPAPVQATRFNELKSGVLDQAPSARRRLDNTLASRGVRGKGKGTPIAENEGNIQDAINSAYFNVYGDYNVPSTPGPVSLTPSTSNLLGQSAGDLGMLYALKDIIGTN